MLVLIETVSSPRCPLSVVSGDSSAHYFIVRATRKPRLFDRIDTSILPLWPERSDPPLASTHEALLRIR